MTDLTDVKKAIVDSVKEIEAQRKADAEREEKAAQRAVEEEKRQISYSFDMWSAERRRQVIVENARIEQQQRDRIAAREKLQQWEQEQSEDEEAQGQANKAILFFMAEKKVFLEAFDKLKTAAEAEAIRNPRLEDACVEWMQKTGTSVTSLSDMSRIIERNGLKRLADDFIEEHGMSPKAKKYFLVWVSPFLQPRPRSFIDDFKDLTRTMTRARAGNGNQDLLSTFLPKLMTETVLGLQQPGQNLMMAYQPHILHLQVKQARARAPTPRPAERHRL